MIPTMIAARTLPDEPCLGADAAADGFAGAAALFVAGFGVDETSTRPAPREDADGTGGITTVEATADFFGKKDKKGKKRVAPRRLPSAVQGLLQYLGGQDAVIQQTRPRGASGADGGESLSRYLAAKTAVLEATKAASQNATIAQQIEQRALAQRQAEETEKKIGMLSVAATKTEASKKKLEREVEQLKGSLQPSNLDWIESIRKQEFREYPLPSYEPSLGSRATPVWAGNTNSSYSVADELDDFQGGDFEPEFIEGSRSGRGYFASGAVAGGGAAAEMYLGNAPQDRPIIRDKPRREPAVRLPPRVSRSVPEKKASSISAAELKASISQVTGLARSRYKLPSRKQYTAVQDVLNKTSGSSADIISALKEAGLNIEET
jgi:hypothetical protein